MDIFKLYIDRGKGKVSIDTDEENLPFYQWLQGEVESLSEVEFWHYMAALNINGFNEEQKASIERRRAINKNLIPENFGYLFLVGLDFILQGNYDKIQKLGYSLKIR